MFSLFLIGLTSLIAVFCYLIMPDHTPMANRMCLPISNQPPGFKVQMLRVVENKQPEKQNLFSKILHGRRTNEEWIAINGYRFDGNDIVIKEYTSASSSEASGEFIERRYNLANVVFPLNPAKKLSSENGYLSFETINGELHHENAASLQALIGQKFIFTKTFLLGTDRFGRDLLSRLMAGSRITMIVGLIAVVISLFIGITLGAVAGFFRGTADSAVMWLINVTWSIPTLLLVIAITLVLGKGFSQVFIAVGLTMWVEVARLVRTQFFTLRETEFVSASRALGFSNTRIILRHILPNILGPILVVAASNFSSAVLIESGLSFLGIGAQPPIPTWGGMIKENYGYIIIPASAYLALLPGVAIMMVSMAFTFLGNGLRDALDSRQQVSIV